MLKKTLGGERLGSGRKMQVGMHGYERSTHDLSEIWRSTMSPGTLVPFLHKVGLPGDTFDIDLEAEIMTHPTVGPLFGSFKVQLDVFMIPWRLYNSLTHNNMLDIGLEMSKIKLPQIRINVTPPDVPWTEVEDLDNAQVNPSSLLAYLGIRGFGRLLTEESENELRYFNAVNILAYWDIYKNYYANKQEKIGAVITGGVSLSTPETVTDVGYEIFDTIGSFTQWDWGAGLEKPTGPTAILTEGAKLKISYGGSTPNPRQIMLYTIEHGAVSVWDLCSAVMEDNGGFWMGTVNQIEWGQVTGVYWYYRTNAESYTVSPQIQTFDLGNIDEMRKEILGYSSETTPFYINNPELMPYSVLYGVSGGAYNVLRSQEGLGIKTYNSDLFNNWLSQEYMTYISNVSAVSTTGNKFTIDQLNLSKKVYEMLNRIAVSGGTYDDWIETVWTEETMRRAESPVYMGGMSKELIFQEVVSQSQQAEQPLGTLAGRGRLSQGQKGGKVVVKCTEPCTIMGIVSLTPRIDYSQGNDWSVHLESFDDLHKPQLDEIGFQDLITEQMAWWATYNNTVAWLQTSAGKQPAWINYMTSVNKTFGNFAIKNNEMFMTLNRRYEYDLEDEFGGIRDLTTYIDPTKYNFIFARTALDAQNFWVQIGSRITARRKMSAKIMPNL